MESQITNIAGFTHTCKVHFKNCRRNRKQIRQGEAPIPQTTDPGTIPRISRLMALAIRFEGLIQRGEAQDYADLARPGTVKNGGIRNYADLARLGLVSRARITQIMNMLNLAPDIQEEILFLPQVLKEREGIT
jgi:hypothetical protein